ncbi:Lipid phosphate phosphohydrolase 3 [Galdieria sulphuraria]|uniref:Phosphatidic acid phosphatase type 2B-like protein n=1 Tax=Galdieria sulphuraria TaxID=130081 RepID=M2XYC4_GALSU|nr:phosphatidic acid phosphatase type 2B-like protein [Galdieria sulphuraria]EME28653.1 phosphatidic acid phosphatase type 2B-like protein [Galdieria sulphuraria]GJD10714.1 Lipid phosphate phosphohydrolase 3 [Galdieria sulphuraria]|eukprot:XP_005705173.1 phosphatidic acid phosphatase type 2B-like protein [Galdieria sulphuraria]
MAFASNFAKIDPLVFIVALAIEIVALILDNSQPRSRPFFLEDATVWYQRASSSTVPFWLIPVVGFAGFVPCMLLLEWVTKKRSKIGSQVFIQAIRQIINYTTAFLLTSAFTQFGKWYVGYLRPDFATRCLGNSAIPPTEYNHSVILSDQQCTSGLQGSIDNGRKSFPSGHASTAMSLCFYFVLYLMHKSTKVASPWIAQVLQVFGLLPLAFGLYVGASRIVDNRHHPADVVAGSLLGILFASIFFWKTKVALEHEDRTEEYLAARMEDDAHEPIELAYY